MRGKCGPLPQRVGKLPCESFSFSCPLDYDVLSTDKTMFCNSTLLERRQTIKLYFSPLVTQSLLSFGCSSDASALRFFVESAFLRDVLFPLCV